MKSEYHIALLQMFDNEIGRFWTKFHIFFIVQVGAIVGLMNQANFLYLNTWAFNLSFFFLVSLSSVNSFLLYRTYDYHRAIIFSLYEIEKTLSDRTEQPMLLITENMKSKISRSGTLVFLIFSIATVVFWFSVWGYLTICETCMKIPDVNNLL